MAVVVTTQTDGRSPAAGTPFTGIDNGQSIIYGFFALTVTGNYVAGGDPMSFAGVSSLIQSGYAPLNVAIQSQSSLGGAGFMYGYRPGGVGNLATLANGKFQVFTSNGAAPNPFLELGAGAYAAAILADTIICEAAFVRV